MEFPRALDPIRAISAAFRILGAATGPILVGGILLALVGGDHGPKLIFSENHENWHYEFTAPLVGFFCCGGLVSFLLECWISCGYARAVEEVARTGATTFGRVFDAGGRFVDMLLARLLAALLWIAILLPIGLIALGAVGLHEGLDAPEGLAAVLGIGAALLYLPVALYFLLGLAFVTQAVALDACSPTRALARSWELARGRRLSLFVFFLVVGLFSFIGVCLCCVGMFLTAPLAIVATNEAYLALTRGDERRSWWIEGRPGTPPAPSMPGPSFVASEPAPVPPSSVPPAPPPPAAPSWPADASAGAPPAPPPPGDAPPAI